MDVPVINSIDESNEIQKKMAVEIIESKGQRKIGILGLSFKAGTDDLRNSPIVDVAQTLYGKGYDLMIYDRNVRLSQLTGTNADFIQAKLPHLHQIITDDLDAVCVSCDVLVVTNKEAEFADLPARYPNKCIVDLVRQYKSLDYDGNYEGISWANVNENPAQDKPLERKMLTTEY